MYVRIIRLYTYLAYMLQPLITNRGRDEPILPAKFLEKLDHESKEQSSGKIGGVSRQNQMLYLNE